MPAEAVIVQKKPLEWEQILSTDLIRTHTKTDDTPHVTDEQIAMYREAGFEAAEKYTGKIWTGIATIQETAEGQAHPRRWRQRTTTQLIYPSLDGQVTMYGRRQLDDTVNIQINPGSRRVTLPTTLEALDVTACCGSGRGAINFDMKMLYRTGVQKAEDIPAGVKNGVLRYIAWAISNPGDELLTVRNRLGTTETGLIGTNNGAWASGAIEAWRMYRL